MKSKAIIILSYILLSFTTYSFAGEAKLPKCCKNKEACCEPKSECCNTNKKASDCCTANEECCKTNEACCSSETSKADKSTHCQNGNTSAKAKKSCCK